MSPWWIFWAKTFPTRHISHATPKIFPTTSENATFPEICSLETEVLHTWTPSVGRVCIMYTTWWAITPYCIAQMSDRLMLLQHNAAVWCTNCDESVTICFSLCYCRRVVHCAECLQYISQNNKRVVHLGNEWAFVWHPNGLKSAVTFASNWLKLQSCCWTLLNMLRFSWPNAQFVLTEWLSSCKPRKVVTGMAKSMANVFWPRCVCKKLQCVAWWMQNTFAIEKYLYYSQRKYFSTNYLDIS